MTAVLAIVVKTAARILETAQRTEVKNDLNKDSNGVWVYVEHLRRKAFVF